MAIIVFFFVKETKGKRLEEKETIFHRKAAFGVDALRRETLDADEFYCHLCGVSFNIIFCLKSGELDVPDDENTQTQFNDIDSLDFTDDDDKAKDPDYPLRTDYEDSDPYEYDSDYESTGGMSIDGEDARDNDDRENSSTDAKDHLEGQMHCNWVLETFDPYSVTRGELDLRVGYFDSPMSGYSADTISPEEARGCRTAQFLMHKPFPRDQWRADELHEPWEIDGDWSLSGICDGTPSRDMNIPTVWPARNGIEEVEADNVNFGRDVAPDDIAMPFHPWCFDILCRQSKVQFQRINLSGLMTWRNAEFDWDSFVSFPRAKEVKSSQEQWWSHEDGTEYLVANPLYVPGLPEIFLTAGKDERLPPPYASFNEIKSSQPVTNHATQSHNCQADFLSSLPVEIRLMIIDYLGSIDIARLSIASRAFTELPNSVWYRLVRKEMPWLWEVWEESECTHNSLPWTNLTTADIKSIVRSRSDYARILAEDSYTKFDAEKIAEYRFHLPVMPY
ncbi:Major facilitator superfamily domain general substrate transporter [Penicillium vulpinum]|uniref:F-box domain-containing protein n=1 Tax=Penicillium vulpinum TaxID=29845 RepID=A0A1V6REH9_9EURO|nr:Major facilitator superfamily domain general substrate transporter [Penicillium vulpinum]KAJ5953084.1 Major facilitator superfamily domain general substrate transporter [Penicillium vulpinum]OQD99671.1 hypothetical protein PENVUL_c063G00050 [Penicillium vulpinum]